MPERIQLSRAKGWRMPENTVKVDRSTRWGNPYRWQDYELKSSDVPWDVCPQEFATQLAVDAFCEDAATDALPVKRADIVRELRGKNLACWCKPGTPCHADVLLRLANEDATA